MSMDKYSWYTYNITQFKTVKQVQFLLIDKFSDGDFATVQITSLLNCIELYEIMPTLPLCVIKLNTADKSIDEEKVLYTLPIKELMVKYPLLKQFCIDFKPEKFL